MSYTYPDLATYDPPNADQLRWLINAGVKAPALTRPHVLLTAAGIRAADGRFDEGHPGLQWIVFAEERDVIYWQPKTREIATWNGRAFALGEAAIDKPATCSFDQYLNIYDNPLDWLIAGRDGIVVLDWAAAFDRLRDVPRIAVAESILFQYRRHMQPRLPQVAVIADSERKVAA